MNYLNIELYGINENGDKKKYKLIDFKGKNIILYFYPEDDTPVCTEEANKFNERVEYFKKIAQIIGVSKSDIEDHILFQKKHKLNFILLSDPEEKLKNLFLRDVKEINNIKRSTFILDSQGNVVKFWEKVDIEDHIQEIIDYFKM